MGTPWSLTIDCARPVELAKFWALALGYVPQPLPAGFASWDDWFTHYEIPADEREDGAYLCDPNGLASSLSFLKVPEG